MEVRRVSRRVETIAGQYEIHATRLCEDGWELAVGGPAGTLAVWFDWFASAEAALQEGLAAVECEVAASLPALSVTDERRHTSNSARKPGRECVANSSDSGDPLTAGVDSAGWGVVSGCQVEERVTQSLARFGTTIRRRGPFARSGGR